MGKRTAVVVTGPESAGNRLLASYFVRGGCHGEGSVFQPNDDQLIAFPSPALVIRHGKSLRRTLDTLRRHKWDPIVVVTTREHTALTSSMVQRGHVKTQLEAEQLVMWQQRQIYKDVDQLGLPFRTVSYESLVLHPGPTVLGLMEWADLRTDNLDHEITVNRKPAAPEPKDGNARHYGLTPKLEPRSEFVWWPELDMGYYPVSDPISPYNDTYWAKYESYAATDLGRDITQARVDWVRSFWQGSVVDIGIGCGQFCEAMNCEGYDVSEKAIGWLRGTQRWHDIYRHTTPAITCWDSLEHVPDPERLIAQVGKWVFVSLPIFADAADVLRSRHYRKDEHFWYWTSDGLERWFAKQGFTCRGLSMVETVLGRDGIATYAFERT